MTYLQYHCSGTTLVLRLDTTVPKDQGNASLKTYKPCNKPCNKETPCNMSSTCQYACYKPHVQQSEQSPVHAPSSTAISCTWPIKYGASLRPVSCTCRVHAPCEYVRAGGVMRRRLCYERPRERVLQALREECSRSTRALARNASGLHREGKPHTRAS